MRWRQVGVSHPRLLAVAVSCRRSEHIMTWIVHMYMYMYACVCAFCDSATVDCASETGQQRLGGGRAALVYGLARHGGLVCAPHDTGCAGNRTTSNASVRSVKTSRLRAHRHPLKRAPLLHTCNVSADWVPCKASARGGQAAWEM